MYAAYAMPGDGVWLSGGPGGAGVSLGRISLSEAPCHRKPLVRCGPCAELVSEPSENGVMVNGWRRAMFRLGAAAGIAGPAAFTGAWIASSLRQTRQGPGGLQLSGLAAPDARDPWIMLAGFLVLGGCTVAFGAALRQALRGNATRGAGPGPALIQGAGLLTVAAGLLRRDHMLLNAPGEPGASWHPTSATIWS